jgi:integrase
MQVSRIRLTSGRATVFRCPPGKHQAFLWDTETPSLALRATPTGRKTYVFESRLHGKTIRITIGTLTDWPIEQARLKAQSLKMLIDSGTDPREVERDRQAAAEEKKLTAKAKAVAARVAAITVGEVWTDYLSKRRQFWGELHYRDHLDKAKAGGLPSGRRGDRKKLTQAGPLAALMPLAMKDLDQSIIEAWAAKEGKIRPASARLALRLFSVFLNWCAEQPEYAPLLPTKNPAKTKKTREALGKTGVKKDYLQKGQLRDWFASVQQLQNPAISSCLQVLLLTGARVNEVLSIRWDDINSKWKGIFLHDKVEGNREIPLTPYVENLIVNLPRRTMIDRKTGDQISNPWVFSSLTSESGRLSEPNTPHTRACRTVGIEGLTLHGLRRSFKSLTEWLEVPVGVVAQIQGHKPSATAEKHYTVRPLELLRVHHEAIEAWILEQAGIAFEVKKAPDTLRLAKSG